MSSSEGIIGKRATATRVSGQLGERRGINLDTQKFGLVSLKKVAV
jgi:hypothetical protein